VPGFAQDLPKREFSAGHDFLRRTGDAAQNLPSSFTVSPSTTASVSFCIAHLD
jgi:hypothetical protein